MKKFHVMVIRFKKNIISIILLLFTISLVLFSKTNIQAVKTGLKLWVNSVIPSLFPFFIATESLSKTNIPKILGKMFNRIMKPLFNISGEGSFAISMGWLSGYPVGAKIAVNLRNNYTLSKVECERLLSFTNNSGPLFIIGTCGVSLFGNSIIGILLFISHILGCITVGIIFRFWKKSAPSNESNKISPTENKLHTITFSNFGEILGDSIKSATSTIIMIGGFIVLFSVIISIINTSGITKFIEIIFLPLSNMLKLPTNLFVSLFTGILEITNGISLLAGIKIKQISINIILTSFLLGLGGISVLLQVLSITSKSDLSIKPYIYGKILHGLISSIYTFILITFLPIFNFNL